MSFLVHIDILVGVFYTNIKNWLNWKSLQIFWLPILMRMCVGWGAVLTRNSLTPALGPTIQLNSDLPWRTA